MAKRKAPVKASPKAKRPSVKAIASSPADPLAVYQRSDEVDDLKVDEYLDDHSSSLAFSAAAFDTKTCDDETLGKIEVISKEEIEHHKHELEALKKADPGFYDFLVEHDKELLEFGQDGEADMNMMNLAEASPTESLKEEPKVEPTISAEPLTESRFEVILSSAKKPDANYRNLVILLHAFKAAVISAVQDSETVATNVNAPAEKKKKFKEAKRQDEAGQKARKQQQPKQQASLFIGSTKSMFVLDAAAEEAADLFSTIVGSTLEALPGVLDTVFLSVQKKGKSKDEKIGQTFPRDLKPWQCALLSGFWNSLTSLLSYFYGKSGNMKQVEERVLVATSKLPLLKWLSVTSEKTRKIFLDNVLRLWLEVRKNSLESMDSSLSAYLVIKALNTLAASFQFHLTLAHIATSVKGRQAQITMKSSELKDASQDAQQKLLSECHKALITLITKVGYSWKNAIGFRVIMNSLADLIYASQPDVAYRFCFLVVRQLSQTVRNSILAKSHGAGHKKSKNSKAHSMRLITTARELRSWQFILCTQLCVTLVGGPLASSKLRLLGFPLSSVLSAAIKTEIGCLTYNPWILQCLQMQIKLGGLLGAFIPLGSHLTSLGEMLIKHQAKIDAAAMPKRLANDKKKPRARLSNPTHVTKDGIQTTRPTVTPTKQLAPANSIKPADVQIVLRLSEAQLQLSSVVASLVNSWIGLCIDYLGLLSQHPAFPEVTAPLVFALRRLSKCRNEETRKQLKLLLNQIDTTSNEVRDLRLKLEPQQSKETSSMIIFEDGSTTLSKNRKILLSTRAQEFKLKTEAEQKGSTIAKKDDSDGIDDENSNDTDIENDDEVINNSEDEIRDSEEEHTDLESDVDVNSENNEDNDE